MNDEGDVRVTTRARVLLLGSGEPSRELVPSARSVRQTADVEVVRRLAADELALPTVPFWYVGSVEVYFSDITGWPCDSALLTLRTQRLSGFDRPDPLGRLGAAVATAPDVATARDRAEQVSATLGRLWS